MMSGQSAFSRLLQAVDNREQLQQEYDSLLSELFQSDFWKTGSVELRRVVWTDAGEARFADSKTFGLPGLYIWGVDTRPLYVGITRAAFKKRFARYIWSDRSQCKLARAYGGALIAAGGIDGFPAEIRDWYKRSFRGSNVRLEGAVRFAQEGIDKIWFTLLPHENDKLEEIRVLERALIPVAEQWNKQHKYSRLLNLAS